MLNHGIKPVVWHLFLFSEKYFYYPIDKVGIPHYNH